MKTQLGEVDIKVPRDRNGSYEPKVIGKYSQNTDGLEEKIMPEVTAWHTRPQASVQSATAA
ncbi:transposase [Oscillospiraceae bacterium 50-58]